MTAIKVELELVDGTFTTRMLHAGETIEQFNRNVARSSPALRQMAADGNLVIRSMERAQDAGAGFLSTLRDVSVVATALSVGVNKLINVQDTWVGAVVRTNAEFQRLTVMLRGMSDAADPIKDAAAQVGDLVDMAKNAPFSLDKITDSFVKLKSTGTDPMKGSLQAILDGVAHFGKGGEELQRTVLGISQASGKGVIQMEELRQQIGETMPQAMSLMAASMGVSMATLVKQIQTGRMAAGPALDALYGELDRSFGGSAQRMMQTFGGQLARTKTELQGFAQIIGGINKETGDANPGGFFDTVTKQFRDFNNLLSSSGGQVFAQQVGAGLSEVARWLQTVVEKAIQFRAVIGDAAQFALAVAGLKLLGAAINSVGGAYTSVIRGLDMLKLKFADANTMLSAHQAALRNTALGYESVDRIGKMVGQVTLKAIGAAAISLVPTVAVLGLAIYEIADSFDVFGNRGREAIETLREFGNLAKDQIKNAQKNIDDRQNEVNKDRARIRYEAQNTPRFIRQKDRPAAIEADVKRGEEEANIAQRQAQLDSDRFKLQEARNKILQDDAKKLADLQLAELNRQTEAEERAYQVRRDNIQKEMDERVKEAKKTNGDLDAIEKERAAKLMANAADLYKTEQEQLESAVRNIWTKNGIGPLTLANTLQIDELLKRIASVREKASNLNITGKTPDLGVASNSAQQLQNLEKAVGKTRDAVEGLEDKLHGGNSELGEFLSKLERGVYGNKSAEDVKKLSAEMVELLARKKELEDFNKGKVDLTNDVEAARLRLVERRIALEEKARGRPLTDAEKIRAKFDAGGYTGLGPNSQAQKQLDDALQSLTMQGRVTNALGISFDKTFGQQTVTKLTSLNEVLSKTLGIITNIGSGVNGINFSGLANGVANIPALMSGPGFRITGASGSLLDLIARGESGGDYNATLDNGAWTNGPQNLVSMSLNQVRELQRQMLMNPGNRAKYTDEKGNHVGSSALGKYQIVGTTLDSLMRDLNLSGNELFDQQMQDRLAMALVNRRLGSGQGLAGLRNEWTSLRKVPDSAILGAINSSSNGPTREAAAGLKLPAYNPNVPTNFENPFAGAGAAADTKAIEETNSVYAESNDILEARQKLAAALDATLKGLDESERKLTDDEKKQKGVEAQNELKRKIDEAKESLDGFDKNYRAVSKLIAKDTFGTKDESVPGNAERNKQLLQAARELDKAEKDRGDRQEASNRIESTSVKLKEQQVQLEKQINDLRAKAKNPNVKLDSSELVGLRKELDKYVDDTALVYGKDTDQYKAALEQRKQALAQFGQSELLQDVATSNEKTRILNQGLMNERQARQSAMQQELDQVDQTMEYYRKNGQLDVAATEQFEAQKAAIRKKYAAQDPMGALMKNWSDLQGNLEKASAQWMDNLAGGVTDLIMGTGDLRSVIQGIARDLINMSLKKLMSGFMGSKSGGTGAAAGKAGKAAKGTGKGGALVGAAHTGAFLGAGVTMSRMVDPSVFRHAPRYHTGANQIGGRRLLPGEIPIIAKDDEGIFTKEQMQAMGARMSAGSGNQIQINAPVTVNAQGGSPEHNADLAKQISSEMEATMRGVVVDELQRQMRPGNILNANKTK